MVALHNAAADCGSMQDILSAHSAKVGCHHHFMSEPQPSRDLDPEFVALHRTITECGARILYRGTDVASYNEPMALAQRG
jgi:hypothetical protein